LIRLQGADDQEVAWHYIAPSEPVQNASAVAGEHAFGRRCREPGANKLNPLRDGEAVREHDRLGTAVAGRGEQFERASASGFWVVSRLFRTFGLAERRPALAYAVMAPLIC
jgi:hypothetical protein